MDMVHKHHNSALLFATVATPINSAFSVYEQNIMQLKIINRFTHAAAAQSLGINNNSCVCQKLGTSVFGKGSPIIIRCIYWIEIREHCRAHTPHNAPASCTGRCEQGRDSPKHNIYAKFLYNDAILCVANLAGIDHVIHPLPLGLVVALLKLLNVIT